MANQCAVTGKKCTFGNNVSHAKNRTRRTFKPNLHTKRFKLEDGRTIKLTISAKGLKIIDKKGIDAVMQLIKQRSKDH